jgi:hypothetical protein
MPYDPELEKAVAKSDELVTTMKKSDQYLQLKKFANRQRLPTESEQQAFTRFILKTPEGQALFKSFNQTRGVSVPGPQEPAVAGSGESEGLKKLREIAAQLKAQDPMLSKQQALSKAIQTPAGAAAYLEDRKSRTRVA